MSKLISVKLDLTKIDKSRLFKSEKTGSIYLDLTMWYDPDKEDEFGNNGGVWMSQTKEQRESEEPKIYLGNCKGLMSPQSKSAPIDEDDDLPF